MVPRVARASVELLAALKDAPSGSRSDLGQGWLLTLDFDRLTAVRAAAESSNRRIAKSANQRSSSMTGPGSKLGVGGRFAGAPNLHPRGSPATARPRGSSRRHWHSGTGARAIGSRPWADGAIDWRCAAFRTPKFRAARRSHWPMIEGQGSLAWIPGVCRSTGWLPPAGAPALRVDVEPGR